MLIGEEEGSANWMSTASGRNRKSGERILWLVGPKASYKKTHMINKHETNIIKALKAAKMTVRLDFSIRLSYAGA